MAWPALLNLQRTESLFIVLIASVFRVVYQHPQKIVDALYSRHGASANAHPGVAV